MSVYAELFARVRTGGSNRRKVLGDGLRWVMGAATLEDVQAEKDSVKELADQLQHQDVVIRGTVACLKADHEEIAAVTTKANELINVIDFQIQEL